MTKIITITGLKRSGKGETGSAIASIAADYTKHAVTLGFADKLKIAACRNLGLFLSDEESIAYMDEFKEKGIIEFSCSTEADDGQVISGRKYLQWMGTEYRKLFGEDFWIDQVLPTPCPAKIAYADPDRISAEINAHNVSYRYPGADYVVFTDCRFDNEAARTLALGPDNEVWEITHPETESDGHESELGLDRALITRTIVNDGSLMDLRYKVEQALEV